MNMGKIAGGVLLFAALGLMPAGQAMAAAGDTIDGNLAFGANGANGGSYWDQPSIVDPGTFTYADGANIDSASFAGNVLTINDDVLADANGFEMTFTDVTTPFTGLTLLSSTFTPGLTYSFSSGALVIDWVGTLDTAGPLTATFDVTGSTVPEPAAWLLMIAGIGGIGLMQRKAKQSLVVGSSATTA